MLGLHVHCRQAGAAPTGTSTPTCTCSTCCWHTWPTPGPCTCPLLPHGQVDQGGPTRGIPGPVGEGSPETVGVTLAEQSPSWLPSTSACSCALQGPCFPKHALHSSPIALLHVYVPSYPSSRCGQFSGDSSRCTIRYTWEADWMISLETCLGPIHRTSTQPGTEGHLPILPGAPVDHTDTSEVSTTDGPKNTQRQGPSSQTCTWAPSQCSQQAGPTARLVSLRPGLR